MFVQLLVYSLSPYCYQVDDPNSFWAIKTLDPSDCPRGCVCNAREAACHTDVYTFLLPKYRAKIACGSKLLLQHVETRGYLHRFDLELILKMHAVLDCLTILGNFILYVPMFCSLNFPSPLSQNREVSTHGNDNTVDDGAFVWLNME